MKELLEIKTIFWAYKVKIRIEWVQHFQKGHDETK